LGTRSSFQVLLDNIKNVAVAFKENKPYFQLTWSTRLAHDDLSMLNLGDEPLKEFLQFMNNNGLLNNTALFILSDPGARIGKIIGRTKNQQGEIEETLPAQYFVLPSWFKKKYPIAWENLKNNQDKLTSIFDVRRTVSQLMNLTQLQEKYANNCKNKNGIQQGIILYLS
jgi:arylsulfatase A-like enzyme